MPPKSNDFAMIEPKWQTYWDENKTFRAPGPGEVPLYEVSGKSHHHFFRCRQCGHMYQIKGCVAALKPLVPRGFKMEDHELFLFGLCAECRVL